MYKIRVTEFFSGAHFLKNYKGKCENLHGHNWKVIAEVSSEKLNSEGMVIDFLELKRILKEILAKFDHRLLNELEEFKDLNPTSENICYVIYKKLKERLKDFKIRITVFETPFSSASYGEE